MATELSNGYVLDLENHYITNTCGVRYRLTSRTGQMLLASAIRRGFVEALRYTTRNGAGSNTFAYDETGQVFRFDHNGQQLRKVTGAEGEYWKNKIFSQPAAALIDGITIRRG